MAREVSNHSVTQIIRLVLPLAIANATDVVMRFSDQFFLTRTPGQDGELLLAAAMNGGMAVYTISSGFFAILMYVNALASQYRGLGRTDMCSKVLRQALLLILLFYPLLLFIGSKLPYVFSFFGHSPTMVSLSYNYSQPLIWASLFALIRIALSSFFTGIGRPSIAMLANLLAVVVNIPLNYLLIFGPGPLPALGLVGAAWATAAASLISALFLSAVFLSRQIDQVYQSRQLPRLRPPLLWKLIRYGGPSGTERVIAMLTINIFVLALSSYGPMVSAAMTITFTWDLLAFIPLTGFNQATIAITGHDIGAGDYHQAKRKTRILFLLALGYVLPLSLLLLIFPQLLVLPFISNMKEAAAVTTLATFMLRLTAAYIPCDAVIQVLTGVLRAAGDTTATMFITMIFHLLLAGIIFVAVRRFQLAPEYCWLIFSLIIGGMAVGMFLRYLGGKWQQIRLIED